MTDDDHSSDSSPQLHWVRVWLDERDEIVGGKLIDALYPTVIRIVRNHLPRGMDEEDLAQEIFTRFFQTLHRYQPRRPLEHWMSRLALNVCLMALRTRRRRPEWRWSDLSDEERAVAESLLHDSQPIHATQAGESNDLLARLLDSLNAKDRMLITLLHLEQRSVDEVRALTGWSATLTRVRAFRAMRKLRKALEALESDGHQV